MGDSGFSPSLYRSGDFVQNTAIPSVSQLEKPCEIRLLFWRNAVDLLVAAVFSPSLYKLKPTAMGLITAVRSSAEIRLSLRRRRIFVMQGTFFIQMNI
ncbi:hypothetical protein ACPVTF_04555 [Geobacillus icigianus]|uniref:hypothetical protein n=1 Tax=Geobacillus icigianus TaxID=1430331 RepID=UPI0018CDC852